MRLNRPLATFDGSNEQQLQPTDGIYLIEALHISITKSMATNMYTAIAVDTGTFRYSNTSSDVLRVSADLVEAGAQPAQYQSICTAVEEESV